MQRRSRRKRPSCTRPKIGGREARKRRAIRSAVSLAMADRDRAARRARPSAARRCRPRDRGDELDRVLVAERGAQARDGLAADRFELVERPRERAERGEVAREIRRLPVDAQRRRERRERQLAAAERALERIRAQAIDELAPADDDPRLRPAEELVAAERDEVGAERDPLGDDRLLRQARSGDRSTSAPLPRSSITGTPRSRPSATSSASATSAVKPTMR